LNDLHKKRAIEAWNKRAPKAKPEAAVDSQDEQLIAALRQAGFNVGAGARPDVWANELGTGGEYDALDLFRNLLESQEKEAVAPVDEIEWLRAWLNTAQRTGIESVLQIMRRRMQKLMIGKGDLCPRPSVELDEAVKVFEKAACHETYKMRDGVAAVLKYAHDAYTVDPEVGS
jgi:hypothetical protein